MRILIFVTLVAMTLALRHGHQLRSTIYKPEGGKPEGGKPEGDKPEGDKPEGDKPQLNQEDKELCKEFEVPKEECGLFLDALDICFSDDEAVFFACMEEFLGEEEGKPEKDGEGKPEKDGEVKPEKKEGEGKPEKKDGEGKPDKKDGEGKPHKKDGKGKPHEKYDFSDVPEQWLLDAESFRAETIENLVWYNYATLGEEATEEEYEEYSAFLLFSIFEDEEEEIEKVEKDLGPEGGAPAGGDTPSFAQMKLRHNLRSKSQGWW